VIRLWNRVGPFRVLALLLLVGAVGGGAAVATHRPVKRPTTASSSTAYRNAADSERDDQRQLAALEADRAEAERAARQDAQRKADEAAVAAAEQAKAVASASGTTSSSSPKPGKSKSPAPPSKPNLPIPSSCGEYSGNRAIGCAELLNMGFGLDQMPCLDKLFTRESGWNVNAYNKSSGAGGIPQALPMSKMASEGADYKTNPATQIRWGLKYIKGRWSTPCGAWAHSQSSGWY
jgi:hypothetical protein